MFGPCADNGTGNQLRLTLYCPVRLQIVRHDEQKENIVNKLQIQCALIA